MGDEFKEYIRGEDINKLTSEIPNVIKKEPNLSSEIALELMSRLQVSSDKDEIQKIFKLFELFKPTEELTRNYLDLYSSIEEKHLLIENLYKFIGETSDEIDMVLEYFQDWMMEDRENIILMIGVLSQLTLNETQKKKVQQLMIKSLEIIEEKDLPVLIQTLYKTFSQNDGNFSLLTYLVKSTRLKKITQHIRKQCALVNDDTLMLICDITSTHSSLNIYVCHILLKSVRLASTISKYDVFILLLCIERKLKDKLLKNQINTDVFISTIEDLKITEKMDEVLYSFCIYFMNPKSDNYELLKSIKRIFFSAFKFHEKIRIDILTLILSSLSDRSSSLSAEILDMISSDPIACEHLSTHSGLLEEAFIHSSEYIDKHIKSIASAFCNSALKNKKIVESIMIFIRKTLFSGQSKLTKIGIILVQISLEKDILEIDDISRVMEWVYQLFEPTIISINNEYILELFESNVQVFNPEDTKKIFELIESLVVNLELIIESEKCIYGDGDRCFSFNSISSDTCSYQFLSKLIKCYTKYFQAVEDSPNIIYELLNYGFNYKDLKEKEKTNFAYATTVSLLQLCDPKHKIEGTEVNDIIIQGLSKAIMFQKYLKKDGHPLIPIDLVSHALIYFSYNHEIDIFISGNIFTEKMICLIWEEMRESYKKDNYVNNLNTIIQRGTYEYFYKLSKSLVNSDKEQIAFYIYEVLGCSFQFFHEIKQTDYLKKLLKDSPKEFFECFCNIFESCKDQSLSVVLVGFMNNYLKNDNYNFQIGNLYCDTLKMTYERDEAPYRIETTPLLLPIMEYKEIGMISELSFLSKLILAPLHHYSYEKSVHYLLDILYCVYEYSEDINTTDGCHEKYHFINEKELPTLLRSLFSVFTQNITSSKIKYRNGKWDIEVHIQMLIYTLHFTWRANYLNSKTLRKITTIIVFLEKQLNDYLSKENNTGIFQVLQKMTSYLDSICEKSKLKFNQEKVQNEKQLRQQITKFWTRLSHFQVNFLETVKINSIDILVEKEDIDEFEPIDEEIIRENEARLNEPDENSLSFFDFIMNEKDENILEMEEEDEEDIFVEKRKPEESIGAPKKKKK